MRKLSVNVATAKGFVCAKAKRHQQHEVGHSVIATGRGVPRLTSSISVDVWTPAEKRLKIGSGHIGMPASYSLYCP
ncbi:hypothetical protein ACQKMV_22050 [Lysinibacillus sp. NPDC094403]|uniref:hypothetical protein n=1 Tax=Lysinibacillus sp. NPDC094403 TaxID=3390581 RepID=UPI003CFEA38C